MVADISLAMQAAAPLADRLLFGLQIALMGMGTVFVGLLIVWALMGLLPRLLQRRAARRASAVAPPPPLGADVAHAIALALFMDLRVFDEDRRQELTVKKLTQPFSPWVYSAKDITLTEKSFLFHRRGRP